MEISYLQLVSLLNVTFDLKRPVENPHGHVERKKTHCGKMSECWFEIDDTLKKTQGTYTRNKMVDS